MENETSKSRKTSASTRSKIFPISVLILIISIIIYRLSTIGPFAPLQCRLLGIGCPDTKVQGYIVPEFIDVKKAFIKNFEDGSEVGSSVAVYYNGKLVVDLYGGYADLEAMREYNKDTLQLVFSSTKTLSSIMIAYLVDRGLLNYDEKISKYWPEFAQGNKENVTLLDLVNHRAGVTYLDRQLTKSELEDLDKLAKILAAQPHSFDGVPLRAYHAATRGWYLNEIVRRVDPKHRTIGQIWYKKNSDPFILESIDRKHLMFKTFNSLVPGLPLEFKEVTKLETFTFESPSATGITNAKSMAKLGAILINNGQPLDDNSNSKPFISKNTIDLISTKLPIEWDYFIGRNLTPSVGGFAYFKFPGLEDVEFLGWGGFGGSLFLWNQELGISFGYVMNAIKMSTFGDKRGWSLLKEIVNVVKKLKKEQSENSFSKNQ
ncbi:beta-lactamase/transpeptidase-like protein [Gigaspora rosea]|uniref:Beta-lactamase/transpeptidase-like protein n=1 Tax=Gigaspora rosea TaxID=44941 RepID=A0A397U8Z4_9GLOM|nr:beta-lactamase/transpeptidase-like protein [Gigaspora rosea]